MERSGDDLSQERYFDRSPIGAVVADDQGRYVDVNEAACEMLGYSRSELLSMRIGDLTVGEGDGDPDDTFESLKRAGEVHTEHRLRHGDGSVVDILLDAVPVGEGRYVAYFQDITTRKEYERRLEESEARYRSMAAALDTSNVGTFILDADFEVVWINEAIEEFFGLSRDDVVGRDKAARIESTIKHIFEDPERFAGKVIGSYEDNTFVQSFKCHVLPGPGREERWLLHWSTPIETGLYAGGRIENYTDITESVRYERDLEDQRDSLQFLNEVLRHDIRNDLSVVKGYTELLEDHVDDEGRALLETLAANTRHALELTQNARAAADVTLTSSEERAPIGLHLSVEKTLDDVREAYPDAVFTTEPTDPSVQVWANEMFDVVLRNLLKNAVQHNDAATPRVEVSATVDPDTATLRISDNGPGIPPEKRLTVFERGDRGRRSDGAGLGLYLVHTLVDRYGGDIHITDSEMGGATFVVELDRAA